VQAQLLRQHAVAPEYEVDSIAQTEALAALALQVTPCVLVQLVQYFAMLQPSLAILASSYEIVHSRLRLCNSLLAYEALKLLVCEALSY
jgi:hypothetical protein